MASSACMRIASVHSRPVARIATIRTFSATQAVPSHLFARARPIRKPAGPEIRAAAESSRPAVRAAAAAQEVSIQGSVLEIDSIDEFEAALSSAGDNLVVLDISSSSCGPCRLIYPKFVELSKEFGEKAVFLKLLGNKSKESL
eukprot:scaffold57705_cov46-Prasinocladus_malaysianus.AAC.1